MTDMSRDEDVHVLKDKIKRLEQQISTFKSQIGTPDTLQQTYISVLNNVPLAVLNISPSGYITIANELVNNLFDLEDHFFDTKIHISNFKPIQATPLIEKIEKLIDLDIPFDDEVPMHFSGSLNYYRVRGVAMKSDRGELHSYLIIIGDITKRKLAEFQLIKAKEKAEESDKLKSAFLTNMSHEIRTPMNHIIGFLDILLHADISQQEKEEYKQVVESSSELLLRKIDDIIDIARIESKQMTINKEQVLVSDLINRIYSVNMKMLQKNRDNIVRFIVNKDVDYNSLVIETDHLRLQQILNNLIDNAFKFTKKGQVELGCYEGEKGDIHFYVKDTGIGIKEVYYKHIFERFSQVDYSTTRQVDGSGLGLAISRGLAELMDGHLSVTSEPDRGSVFSLCLSNCVVHSLPTNEGVPNAKFKDFVWTDKKVLIVEDDQYNYELLRVFLKGTGLQISRAKTGHEAVQMVQTDQPELILMDIQLPGMNGFETTQIIKESFPNITIIAQTAYANNTESELAKKVGINAIISKPIARIRLLNAISQYI